MDNVHEFIDRYIRARAIAPPKPGLPRLTNQARRSWWQFCLGMHDLIRQLVQQQSVDQNQVSQLVHLQWLMLKGTYVFETPDPALRDEQHRYIEICVNVAVAFAVIVDEPTELKVMCTNQYHLGSQKIPAIAQALLENQLNGWQDWREAASPVGWLKVRTAAIHKQDHTQGGLINKSDALYRTSQNAPAITPADDYETADRERLKIEEVAELPGEVNRALARRWTPMALETLIAAVRDDHELLDYMKLRFQGFGPRAAWERLGWSLNHGRAVDRRFRRARTRIKATGFEYQPREIERAPGISDASCMVVKERLRISVPRRSEATLSGRVVYEPRVPGQEND